MNTYQIVGLFTLIRKELVRVFRIWAQTLLPSVITTTLYFLIFGNFIGHRIGKMDTVSFIDFIIPGLIMMSVITNSYSNVVSSVFSSKFQRNIEELLVSPLRSYFIVFGYVCGGTIRGIIVGGLVTLTAFFFSPIELYNIPITILSVLCTAIIFSTTGFINGLFAKRFDDTSIVTTFILTPLTYLGGVFYSISELPAFWQTVSLFNPIFYLVNIFRYGCIGVTDISIPNAILGMIMACIGLLSVAIYLIKIGYGIRQ